MTPDDRNMTLDEVLAREGGVLTSAIVREFVGKSSLQWRTSPRGRWQRPLPGVVVDHNGPLSQPQMLRAAVLYGGNRALLSHATCAALAGLKGYEDTERVHLLLPYPASVRSRSFVVVHSSRNPAEDVGDAHPAYEPRRLRLPRALVEMARTARTFDDARGPLAAAVQQGLTRPDDVRQVLARAGPMRFQAQLFAALDDIELGAHSGLELDFLRLLREHRLPSPTLQERVEAAGVRKLDAFWPAYAVWVEIDGAGHRDDDRWQQQDLDRHNELSTSGRRMCSLRFSGHLLRTRRTRCAGQVAAALERGGWVPR